MAKAKFNRRANFRVGDTVKIASIATHPIEGVNWMTEERREGNAIYYGKELRVNNNIGGSKWIRVDGLQYAHPAEKFKLVKRAKPKIKC